MCATLEVAFAPASPHDRYFSHLEKFFLFLFGRRGCADRAEILLESAPVLSLEGVQDIIRLIVCKDPVDRPPSVCRECTS